MSANCVSFSDLLWGLRPWIPLVNFRPPVPLSRPPPNESSWCHRWTQCQSTFPCLRICSSVTQIFYHSTVSCMFPVFFGFFCRAIFVLVNSFHSFLFLVSYGRLSWLLVGCQAPVKHSHVGIESYPDRPSYFYLLAIFDWLLC